MSQTGPSEATAPTAPPSASSGTKSQSPESATASPRDDLRLVLVTAAILSLAFFVKTWDTDDLWHLETGRWILEHRSVPHVDPFSFTAKGKPWLAVPWLSDTFFFLGYRLFGWVGVSSLKVLCAFGTLAALGRGLIRSRTSAGVTVATLVVVAYFLQGRTTTSRPEVLGTLFAAIVVGSVTCAEERVKAPKPWLAVAPVLLAFGLWPFAHTSCLLTPALAIAWLAGALVRRSRLELRLAAAVLLASGLALGLAPQGREAITEALMHSARASATIIGATVEWRPPTLSAPGNMVLLAFAATALLGAAASLRTSPERALLLGLGLALWLRGQRSAALFVLLGAPAFAVALSSAKARLASGELERIAPAAPYALAGLVVLAHLALAPAEKQRILFGSGVEESRFCGDSLAVLRRAPQGRTLNDFHLGGYLMWHGLPDGIFWDGRNLALYTEDDFRTWYHPAMEDPRALEATRQRFDARYIIGSVHGDFEGTATVSPGWLPLFYGKSSTLFVHESAVDNAIRAGLTPYFRLRFIPVDEWLRVWYGPIVASEPMLAELASELRRALSERPSIVLDTLTFLDEFAPNAAKKLYPSVVPH
jgi:hypothetical protein